MDALQSVMVLSGRLSDVLDQLKRDAQDTVLDGVFAATLERSAFIGAVARWSQCAAHDATATMALGSNLALMFDAVDDRRAARISLHEARSAIAVASKEADADDVCKRLMGSCVANAGSLAQWQTVDAVKLAACVRTILVVKAAMRRQRVDVAQVQMIANRQASAIVAGGGAGEPQFQKFCVWFRRTLGLRRAADSPVRRLGFDGSAAAASPTRYGSGYSPPGSGSRRELGMYGAPPMGGSVSGRGAGSEAETAYFDLAAAQEVASSLRYALALQKQEHFELIEKYQSSTLAFQSQIADLQARNAELLDIYRNPIYKKLSTRLTEAFKESLAAERALREKAEEEHRKTKIEMANVDARAGNDALISVPKYAYLVKHV